MKLDPMEKRADSILRQYNNQLTKAYGQLGKTHTVSANLLSKARDLFGENNIRYNKNGVPQIARNRDDRCCSRNGGTAADGRTYTNQRGYLAVHM